MNKIEFKDLPSTDTPFNAETFNTLQDNVESAINEKQDAGDYALKSDINSLKGTVLWENSNPSSEFGSQTVTLNSSDYDILEIFYCYNPASTASVLDGYQSIRLLKGLSGGVLQRAVVAELEYFQIQSRTITRIDDTHYTFGNGRAYISSTNSYSTVNNRVIPIKIIGYKMNGE